MYNEIVLSAKIIKLSNVGSYHMHATRHANLDPSLGTVACKFWKQNKQKLSDTGH